MRPAILAFAAALSLPAAPAALAQGQAVLGDPEAGARLAGEVCAGCHAVAPGERTSPDATATPFATIAETPGMTARAITVWLTTFHPERTMPAIVLTRDEREDIIAYIRSLDD